MVEIMVVDELEIQFDYLMKLKKENQENEFL
jgi:hypothetical protein